jgi:hypothetical protein
MKLKKRIIEGCNKMNEKKIYPDTDASEIIDKATKCQLGIFFKQYRKGDFLYTIEKKPFKDTAIVTVHVPTKTVFGYNKMFNMWDELPLKF